MLNGSRGCSGFHARWLRLGLSIGPLLLVIAWGTPGFSQPSQPTSTREARFSRGAEAEIRFQEGLLHYNRAQLAQAEADFKPVPETDSGAAPACYYPARGQPDQNRPADSIDNFYYALRL